MPAEQERITLAQHEAEIEELDRSADEVVQFWRAKTRQLEAELLAAQEREKVLFRQYDEVLVLLIESAEREKALREAFREYADELTGQVHEEILAILAGSPSEKPDSEDRNERWIHSPAARTSKPNSRTTRSKDAGFGDAD